MVGISIQLDSADLKRISKKLTELSHRVTDFSPVMEEAGDYMVRSIRNRIMATKTAPDGTRWAPNSELTQQLKGANNPGYYTGAMVGSLKVADADRDSFTVAVGTDYAGYFQKGVSANRGKYGHGKPTPARPFMGFSPENKRRIAKMMRDYISTGLIEEESFGG